MLKLSLYKREDFSILQSWFKAYDWKICTEASISKDAYFVYKDDKPIAFSYFVSSNIDIAWLGFVITDKAAKVRDCSEALDMLLPHIFTEAKLAGFEFMLYATNTKAVVRRLERLNLMQVVNNTQGYKLAGALTGKDLEFFHE